MDETRKRLCDAMLGLSSEQGYEQTSIDQIVELAGVSREDFDRIFSSKEACAIAAFDALQEDFNSKVNAAYESEATWPDSLRAAANTAAIWIAENERAARFGTLALLWAGEVAQARREAAFQYFAGMIDAGREVMEDPDQVPAHTAEAVIGSITEMITKQFQAGDVHPPDFVPELMYVAVRPYLGQEAANRELQIPPKQPQGEPS